MRIATKQHRLAKFVELHAAIDALVMAGGISGRPYIHPPCMVVDADFKWNVDLHHVE